ncbi:hypothetical protein M408DRAFT_170481 [Serendipita vermifera MAFF 305830]|uniref:Uncharacterized protein n=1 Tax=Serendipita vermifera MAFF 305830 TaxID=933852 RepID=A0A0C3ARJ3_SERVB|nr:hypothetical protein M408DRAFT_170481 [Serendipita vermifera MAFF 305830]
MTLRTSLESLRSAKLLATRPPTGQTSSSDITALFDPLAYSPPYIVRILVRSRNSIQVCSP